MTTRPYQNIGPNQTKGRKAEEIHRTESTGALEVEYFTFMQQVFNVTAILDDLAAGTLKPTMSEFHAEFIESFATRLSHLKKDEPYATGVSILTGVRAADVHAIPAAAYEKPLILAYAGKNKGLLNIDGTGPHYLLVDGNKRLGKAFFEGRPKLDVAVLSQAQSRKYKQR
ncbi:TPA: hypothetical protein QDB04_000158 [Burkholderia vietnamiensis]|nr:hypothetical protein [Burkholderia vietnamiensis]